MRLRRAFTVLALAAAPSCGGEEFRSTSASTGGAAGSAGSTGGASAGGGMGGATGGTGGASGASTGGAGRATGGSGGTGATGGTGGTGATGGTGGTGGGPPLCPAPSNPTPIATSLPTRPEYPVISGGNVYFTTDGGVWRVPVSGGPPVPIHTSPVSWNPPSNNEGLAVSGDDLYCADRGRGELRRIDLNTNAVTVVQANQVGIQTVATDATHVYWTHAGGIRRRQNSTEDLFSSPDAYALALGDTEVFWVTRNGEVHKGPKTGGQATPLAVQAPPAGAPFWEAVSIALDENHVYFTARTTNGSDSDGVWRVPRAGGAVEQVLVASGAEGLALSASCIYMGHRGQYNGRVYVRDKGLAEPIVNLGNLQHPRGLAIEGTTLIIADSMAGSILRATL